MCVYGGTSGGIVAAVELARLGKKVELLVPGGALGGMTAGGLSNTDVGVAESIGGMAKEFYQTIGSHYGEEETFRFEPRVATAVFQALLNTAGVVPRSRQVLSSVTKSGAAITMLTTASGLRVHAKVFIDATYEGDLMALAGVAYTWGREGAWVYHESLAGIRPNEVIAQFPVPIDPFRHSGNPASGLVFGVAAESLGVEGEGDDAVQAYNYRLCLTSVPTNRVAIRAPSNYRESDYALLAREIAMAAATGTPIRLRDIFNFAALPNWKFDVNGNGPCSTDCVGLSAQYPEATTAKRVAIAARHRAYAQGLLYFLGHSLEVPATMRWEMLQWGFCADEFVANGGWPTQFYVREARRMLGAYVMQQANCESRIAAADPIALGSYPMDSHVCRRLVVNGIAQNEGLISRRTPQPYGIAYRSIMPRPLQCTNLFVTFAISSSHVAFASLRMEPVFMMLSQSAADAASQAIDLAVPIQAVPYDRLAAQLSARGQILSWPPQSPVETVTVENPAPGATGN